jgi:hypothetical protein
LRQRDLPLDAVVAHHDHIGLVARHYGARNSAAILKMNGDMSSTALARGDAFRLLSSLGVFPLGAPGHVDHAHESNTCKNTSHLKTSPLRKTDVVQRCRRVFRARQRELALQNVLSVSPNAIIITHSSPDLLGTEPAII